MESQESRTSEDQQIIRDLRSEVVRLRASDVPPNLTRDHQAKIECQMYETQSSERSSDNTGFSETFEWSQPQHD